MNPFAGLTMEEVSDDGESVDRNCVLGTWPVAGITTSAVRVRPSWRDTVMGPLVSSRWNSSAGMLTREPRTSLVFYGLD